MPQAWECKLLTILKSEPCLTIRRRTWSERHVVSTARLVYPGNRYRLEAVAAKSSTNKKQQLYRGLGSHMTCCGARSQREGKTNGRSEEEA
jgi:hypothetical protein